MALSSMPLWSQDNFLTDKIFLTYVVSIIRLSFLNLNKRMSFKARLITVAMAGLIVLLQHPNDAQARPWEWARRLPINQYTPEDIAILKQNMTEILNQGNDGEPVEWSNPETGHAGSITPLTTVHQSDKLCRQTRFTGFSNGTENVSEFFLCKQADGVWAVEQPLAR